MFQALKRHVQRNILNKFHFFKSLNLLGTELTVKCEIQFFLLQFKIHFNLKTDNEYDLFYEKCKELKDKLESL